LKNKKKGVTTIVYYEKLWKNRKWIRKSVKLDLGSRKVWWSEVVQWGEVLP